MSFIGKNLTRGGEKGGKYQRKRGKKKNGKLKVKLIQKGAIGVEKWRGINNILERGGGINIGFGPKYRPLAIN
jgi:hypothetical protein